MRAFPDHTELLLSGAERGAGLDGREARLDGRGAGLDESNPRPQGAAAVQCFSWTSASPLVHFQGPDPDKVLDFAFFLVLYWKSDFGGLSFAVFSEDIQVVPSENNLRYRRFAAVPLSSCFFLGIWFCFH